MKRIALTILALAILTPAWTHAARKVRAKEEAPAAVGDKPSARLERPLEQSLDAILEPLEREPRMPRVEVEKLRSSFAAGQIKAQTPAQKQIYQNAMAVCESLTKAMDDRAKAQASALASAKVPSISSAGGIVKSSPVRGADAGANAEAIRRKQLDERRYSDKQAKAHSAFVESTAYKAWTEKSAYLRQNVMALYTRQMQLEALDEKNTAAAEKAAPPAEKPTPVVSKAAEKKSAPAKDAAYAGTWTGRASVREIIIRDDHTGTRTDREGNKVKGTWAVEADGDFHVKWEDRTHWKGKLTEDGQTMNGTVRGMGQAWTRKKP